jgi:hypothetical protein
MFGKARLSPIDIQAEEFAPRGSVELEAGRHKTCVRDQLHDDETQVGD